MAGNVDTLEFDLGQKWAKGLRIHFCNVAESAALQSSPEFEEISLLKQVHSKKLVPWSAHTAPSVYRETQADGFIARGAAFKNSKKKLVIRTADCCPLFYVDRENEVAAVIHAGWKGLQQGIHLLPFREGFDPKSTWIWCGPCLNGENFEVDQDMWSTFPTDLQQNPNFFALPQNASSTSTKRYFHTWNFLHSEFKKLDVALFYNLEIDTFSDPNFHSYRRWKKEGNSAPTPHNYSWMSFVEESRS